MAGIISYGTYVPHNRLDRAKIFDAYGKIAVPGEKAVANYDEDSITMGAAAALDCCKYIDPQDIQAVYFASTTSPYKEKQCATVISGVLDTRKTVRTADFCNTLRAGSAALLAALDGAKDQLNVLVAISDSRLGAADGQNEAIFGDGAAAFLIGKQSVIAEILDWYSISDDFHDQWRSSNDIFVRNWEERYCITQGYNKVMTEAAQGVLAKTGLKPSDFFRIVVYARSLRYQSQLAVKLGFSSDQIQDGFFASIGNSGAACAPLMLAAALDEAKPGDKILLLNYGEGCDAIVFAVTDEIVNRQPRMSIKKKIAHKSTAMNYEKYLRWKQLLTFEPAKRPRQEKSSLPAYYRDSSKNLALYGCRCRACGTPQFPASRICVQCQAIDQMEKYRFYGRKAKVASFTIDYLADSLDPPNVAAMIDFAGGGRMVCHLIDCELDKIQIGMEVDLSFRCLFTVEGIRTYYWKAVPKQIGEDL